jgi:hypothetical protein
MEVFVRDDNVDRALRALKKKMQRSGKAPFGKRNDAAPTKNPRNGGSASERGLFAVIARQCATA